MSNDAANAQAVLFEEVYLPAFIQKCAELGQSFEDQQSLRDALESVAMLNAADSTQKSNVVKSAASTLREALGVADPSVAQQTAEKETAVKQASSEKAGSDKVRSAIDALVSAQ